MKKSLFKLNIILFCILIFSFVSSCSKSEESKPEEENVQADNMVLAESFDNFKGKVALQPVENQVESGENESRRAELEEMDIFDLAEETNFTFFLENDEEHDLYGTFVSCEDGDWGVGGETCLSSPEFLDSIADGVFVSENVTEKVYFSNYIYAQRCKTLDDGKQKCYVQLDYKGTFEVNIPEKDLINEILDQEFGTGKPERTHYKPVFLDKVEGDFQYINHLCENLKGICIEDNVNIRADMNTSSEKLGKLYKGDRLELIGKGTVYGEAEENGASYCWYKIRNGNVEGFVYGAFIRLYRNEEELEKIKDFFELKVVPNYNDGNGTIIFEEFVDNTKTEIRKCEFEFKIGTMVEDDERAIFDNYKNGQKIGELQYGDNIKLLEVCGITYFDKPKLKWGGTAGELWYKVQAGEVTGWIHKSLDTSDGNPYIGNTYEILDEIEDGERKWTVRKIDQWVSVWYRINVRENPGLNGKKIFMIHDIEGGDGSKQENYRVVAITEETDTIDDDTDYWLKIEYKPGEFGWIFGGNASVERGGPKYYIPDHRIEFDFGDAP